MPSTSHLTSHLTGHSTSHLTSQLRSHLTKGPLMIHIFLSQVEIFSEVHDRLTWRVYDLSCYM